MGYLDRLRETLELTSPEGNQFSTLWKKDPRTRSKTVGVFKYPRVRGVTTQDLDVGGTSWPLTLFFAGDDHDLESKRFMDAVDERGLWRVVHPVRGDLDLQLLSATENMDPITSGPFTQIDTDWLEPLITNVVPTSAQLRSDVVSQVDDVNEVSGDQLEAVVVQQTASEVSAFRSAVNTVVSTVENTLEKVSAASADITAQMNSIKRGITDVLAVVPMDILATAAQIQSLVQLPGLVVTDINARIEVYGEYAQQMFNLSPDSANNAGRNIAAVKELALVSAVAAVAQVTATGELTSRLQAVELMEFNGEYLNDIVDDLDLTQEQFGDLTIDRQYFSQSTSFPQVALITAQTLAYLLRAGFDLAIEKRFVLDRPRAPIEITITEYGSLGEDDANFDLFIDSNSLKGNDILLLPAGREVVVYV